MTLPYQNRIRYRLAREGCPATLCLLLATAVLFVIGSLLPAADRLIANWIAFDSSHWFRAPWSLVTGSLISGGALMLLCNAIWIWFVGGTLERSLGTRTFVGLWCAISAVTGLALYLGFLCTHQSAPLFMMVVLDALTVSWAMLNWGQLVLFMGMLPLRAQTLALIGVIWTLIFYQLPLGLFALAGCLLAWGFVEWRRRRRRYQGVIDVRPASRRRSAGEASGLVGRLTGWRQRRRFEKLMRDSGIDSRTSSDRR